MFAEVTVNCSKDLLSKNERDEESERIASAFTSVNNRAIFDARRSRSRFYDADQKPSPLTFLTSEI